MALPQRKTLHFDLPPLPYAEDALAPIVSAETLQFHHGKHHKKYIDTMNQLLEKNPMEGRNLEDIVRNSSGKLFNNAAQAWNHDFFWHSLSPRGGRPAGALLAQLERDFGSYERFVEAYARAGNDQFGSGWAWLVEKDGKLQVAASANADTPMAHGVRCLLAVDVWEHAYYIDYRNQRDRFLAAVIEKRLNWAFAEQNLSGGKR
ncbi:MAG: superoxide dismutase [Betaproteobacteria bacterium]